MHDDAFILIVADGAVSTVEFVLVFLVRLNVVSQAIFADLLNVVQLVDGRGVMTPVFDDIVDLLNCFMQSAGSIGGMQTALTLILNLLALRFRLQ